MSIFDSIWNFLQWPMRYWFGWKECGTRYVSAIKRDGSFVYDQTCTEHDGSLLIGVISALVIYGFVVLVVVLIGLAVRAVVRAVHRYATRQECQHCTTLTNDVGEIAVSTCYLGLPCCASCAAHHPLEALQERAAAEPIVLCPRQECRRPMRKDPIVELGIIADVCPADNSIYLGADELQAYITHAERNGYSRGHSDGEGSGTSTGLVIGLALGSAIN